MKKDKKEAKRKMKVQNVNLKECKYLKVHEEQMENEAWEEI